MKKADVEQLISGWYSRGLVSEEQSVVMREDLNVLLSEKSGQMFINIFMRIGALALSLGALLLIASNWEYMGKGVKLALTILMPVLPLSFAYLQMSTREEFKIIPRAMSVLGMTLIGGSLAMIGQIYHLDTSVTWLLWIWCILAAPFALLFKRAEHIFGIALLFGSAAFFSIIEVMEGGDESSLLLAITFFVIIYSGLLYTVGSLFRYTSGWVESAHALRMLAAAGGSGIGYFMTFEWYARILTGEFRLSLFGPRGVEGTDWVILSILFNLAFIGFLGFVIYRGVRFEDYRVAFSAIRLFAFYLLTKYFTLFFGMLETGLFFIFGGVLFIAGGWFIENKKQQFVSYMKQAYHPAQRVSLIPPKKYEE